MRYGYARVSSVAQDHAHQVAELEAAGCERIFTEKASAAAGRKRPALRQALAILAPGDVLIVTRLNRLARSTRDALNALEAVRTAGADFTSLRETWADTTTPAGRLAVTILAGFAEFDREMVIERTGEGRRNAQARGVRLGRKPNLNPTQKEFVRQQRRAGVSEGELATLLGVSRSTISRVTATTPAPAAPSWHAPTCAAFTSGAGNTVRCTCGGIAHGARGEQRDIEELTHG